MSVNEGLLQLAYQVAERSTRAAAAQELARVCGAAHLLIFVHDAEVDQMLTLVNMPRTLPDGRRWQKFLRRCVSEGEARDALALTADGERLQCVGFRATHDVVAVLAGTDEPSGDVTGFRMLLPLLGAACHAEHLADIAKAQARIADETAIEAAALMRALDEAQYRLQRANEHLHARAGELLEANSILREQAIELEAQAAQLESQAKQLNAANAELEAARAEADAANQAKSQFLTNMSHELRTPLNAISGYVELMQLGIHGPLTNAQRDALERIERSQRHLLSLINEILSLARIEAGGVDYRITEVTVRDALDELKPLVEPQLAAKTLTYHVEMPAANMKVRADREKLTQILLNLLSNAIKFTAPGGTIRVFGHEADDSGIIGVADTGRGIPSDKLQSIFEPFVQVDGGHTRTADGTGLGLAISRDLAVGMGGELRVESHEGEGSVFFLALPKAITV